MINLGDLLWGYISDFHFLGKGRVGDIYRLGADIVSIAILTGIASMLIRRFILRSKSFLIRQETTVHPQAIDGTRRDSLIVGVFILFHVGWRLLGESFHIALRDLDRWQPFASAISRLWAGWSPKMLDIDRHVCWWSSIGSILIFLPYFLTAVTTSGNELHIRDIVEIVSERLPEE